MWIKTKDDTAGAIERLKRRSPAALAAFIVSLAQDAGPVGEFLSAADSVRLAAESAKQVYFGEPPGGPHEYRGAE